MAYIDQDEAKMLEQVMEEELFDEKEEPEEAKNEKEISSKSNRTYKIFRNTTAVLIVGVGLATIITASAMENNRRKVLDNNKTIIMYDGLDALLKENNETVLDEVLNNNIEVYNDVAKLNDAIILSNKISLLNLDKNLENYTQEKIDYNSIDMVQLQQLYDTYMDYLSRDDRYNKSSENYAPFQQICTILQNSRYSIDDYVANNSMNDIKEFSDLVIKSKVSDSTGIDPNKIENIIYDNNSAVFTVDGVEYKTKKDYELTQLIKSYDDKNLEEAFENSIKLAIDNEIETKKR